MNRIIFASIAAALAVVGAIIFFTQNSTEAIDFYDKKIRSILFSGLLTVGSFLLSLKVFIVVKFKENIFDSESYKEKLAERRRINPDLTHYGPVRNLSKVLFISISASLLASASQVTIGLISEWWALLICVGLAAFAGVMLLQVLFLIRSILKDWLDHMEDKPKK